MVQLPAQPPDALEEIAQGGTPAGRSANAALRALSKAARAFTLYEPQNEAIRRFLEEYRDAVQSFLRLHGPLELEVRAHELVREGEVVHGEKDRERSLAFRLYRDGVRKLFIDQGVPWPELLKLLEVVSVRFIGVRQQEEDVVTLLTRAAFTCVRFTAIAGFVARDDDEDGDTIAEDDLRKRRQGLSLPVPDDFDGHAPPLLPPRQLGYYPIPDFSVREFEAEESAAALPGNAVRMVRELLDDAHPEELETLVPAVGEVRDFLVSELDVKHLRDLARVVAGQYGHTAKILGPAMTPLAAPHTLQKLVGTIPPGGAPSDALVELLDILISFGAEPLEPLLDRIEASIAHGAPDPSVLALVTKAARKHEQTLVDRLSGAGAPFAALLVELLAKVAPARLPEAAKVLVARAEVPVALEGLNVFARVGAVEGAANTLLALLQSPHQPLRLRAAELLAQFLERRAFPALQHLVVGREPKGLDEREADVMGEALATVAPREAAELFAGWVRPPRQGLLARLSAPKPKRMLAWTAAAGLASLPGEESQVLLKEIAAHADDDLRRRCQHSLALWRRGGGRG